MKSTVFNRMAGTLIVVLMASAMLTGCDSKSVAEKQMKFVNIEQVIVDSGLAIQEKTHLEAVRQRLMDGAKLAEGTYKNLPKDKVEQARQADSAILNAKWNSEQAAANNIVLSQVAQVAEQYRAAHHIDAIMPVRSALSYSKDLDVSADLVASLKDTKVSFGDLPKITQKEESEPVAESK